MRLSERCLASRFVFALAVCVVGASACKKETPASHRAPERQQPDPDRARSTLLKRRQIPGEYLIGLRRGQDPSALTDLLPNFQNFEPRRLPGTPTMYLLHSVPDDQAGKIQTLSLALEIGCFQPNYEVEVDPEEMAGLAPEDTTVDVGQVTPPPAGAVTGADAPVVGVIDTGAFVTLKGIDAIVWTNKDEDDDGYDDDSNGYIDDVHGFDALSATGTPPLDAGSVSQPDADHGSIVGAIATGVCGPSRQTGTPVKFIPCRAMTTGSYDSNHFVMCLKYFAALTEKGVPLAAINGSFGTTTEKEGSCEVEMLGALRDKGVLFVVAAGDIQGGSPTFPGRHRVANVVPVASVGSYLARITSISGSSVAYVAGAVGSQSFVLWPFLSGATGLGCQPNNQGTVSYAVPQVTNLAARLAAQPSTPGTDSWFERRNLILAGSTPLNLLKGETLSGRLVPTADVIVPSPPDLSPFLSCTGQTVAGRIAPVGGSVNLAPGQPLVIQAYNLSCAAGIGSIPVKLEPKTCTGGSCVLTINLEDSGVFPGDELAGDGLYGKKWTVPTSGWTEFTVTLWPTGSADSFDVKVGP